MRDLQAIRAQLQANPDAILHVWPTYTPNALDDPRDELLWGWIGTCSEIVLRLGRFPLHFTARVGPPEIIPHVPESALIWTPTPRQPPPMKMKHWGLTKLGDTVWAVTPSIHTPGAFHGYVVLCDAPNPAPWEDA